MDTDGWEACEAYRDQRRFSYRHLYHDEGEEFRLVKISGTAAKPSCTIKHFRLDSAPAYKAVSYRWGDSLGNHEILVNKLLLNVSDNLFDFLSRQSVMQTAKYEDQRPSRSWPYDPFAEREAQWIRTPWIWIDQLCIDQSSIEEKNHRVARMGFIYSKALQVLVWLGKGTDGTEEAVRVAARNAVRRQGTDRENSELQAFQKIVSNQYWSRLWIIQEFVLARQVVIMSGSAQISGALLRELVRDVAKLDQSLAIARIWPFMMARRRLTAAYMQQRMALPQIAHPGHGLQIGPPLPSYEELSAPSYKAPISISTQGRHRDKLDREPRYIRYHDSGLRYTWQDLMKLAKKAECRDVRDRVYGMLSMVKPQVRIVVNYATSSKAIREQVVEVEFEECYDRPYTQEALEEVQDEDFERFLDDLDFALELKDNSLGAEEPEGSNSFTERMPAKIDSEEVPQKPASAEPLSIDLGVQFSEVPCDAVERGVREEFRLSRAFAKIGPRRLQG